MDDVKRIFNSCVRDDRKNGSENLLIHQPAFDRNICHDDWMHKAGILIVLSSPFDMSSLVDSILHKTYDAQEMCFIHNTPVIGGSFEIIIAGIEFPGCLYEPPDKFF